MSSNAPPPRARTPRSDGIRTRQAILDEAARLATVEGLEGLSLARLADRVGMSKSGLFAHFGSKEELQLATIERATEIFEDDVMRPAADAPDGVERLRALLERFLEYVERSVFPGGCFFASAAAEFDTRSGPVRDRAFGVVADWREALARAVRDAQAEGLIARDVDVGQLVFELNAFALLANAQFVASGSEEPLELARRAIEARLAAVAGDARP